MWWVLSLAHCVCVGCMLPMSLVYASGMPGVCGCMAAGSCAVVTGYVAWCGVWLAGFLAGWVYGSVAGWLSGSPWEGDFGGQISGHFQLQNREKIPSKSLKIRGNFGGFQPDFRTAKTKTEKPKTQNPHQKPRKENPKKKTQNPFK